MNSDWFHLAGFGDTEFVGDSSKVLSVWAFMVFFHSDPGKLPNVSTFTIAWLFKLLVSALFIPRPVL